MWGLIMIGAGAVVAGILGLALPPRQRLAAVFPLVIGAGVGVAALAVGGHGSTSSSEFETTFLVASALGFISVIVSAAIVWARMGGSTPEPPPPASDRGES